MRLRAVRGTESVVGPSGGREHRKSGGGSFLVTEKEPRQRQISSSSSTSEISSLTTLFIHKERVLPDNLSTVSVPCPPHHFLHLHKCNHPCRHLSFMKEEFPRNNLIKLQWDPRLLLHLHRLQKYHPSSLTTFIIYKGRVFTRYSI